MRMPTGVLTVKCIKAVPKMIRCNSKDGSAFNRYLKTLLLAYVESGLIRCPWPEHSSRHVQEKAGLAQSRMVLEFKRQSG